MHTISGLVLCFVKPVNHTVCPHLPATFTNNPKINLHQQTNPPPSQAFLYHVKQCCAHCSEAHNNHHTICPPSSEVFNTHSTEWRLPHQLSHRSTTTTKKQKKRGRGGEGETAPPKMWTMNTPMILTSDNSDSCVRHRGTVQVQDLQPDQLA